MTEKTPAQRYRECYDAYHTSYALHRLGGWNGDKRTTPASLLRAYEKMDTAFQAFYMDAMGRERPNHVDLAQKLVTEAAESMRDQSK